MFDKKVFAARLRAKRGEHDWTQGELAERSGLSPSAIVHYEDDADPGYIPGADKLWALACALDVDVAWLMGWDVAHPEVA